MHNKKFIFIVFITSLLMMIFVGVVNFVVDPGYVYLKKYYNTKTDEYVKKIFMSKQGLVSEGWNERVVKTAMAKYAGDFDCILLGSSHIMQVSSVRKTGDIQKVCTKLLNLGVSGGSFEDMAVFTNIILENKEKPKQVFLDIDPWTLKFGMDKRYQINQLYYDSLIKKLDDKTQKFNHFDYQISLIKNLFNLKYFFRSLKELNTIFKEPQIELPKNNFTYNNGYLKALTLPDGSHLYATKWMNEQKVQIKQLPLGGGDYKINGKDYDEKVVEYLIKIIKLYKVHDIKVSFIMTPYHPNVFKVKSKTVKHIEEVDKIVTKISKVYGISVYGSFFPEKLGCKDDEFLDFMHPTTQCLDKIQFGKIK